MNDFHDDDHSVPELIIQGSVELDLASHCNTEMLNAIEKWHARPVKTDARPSDLCLDKSQVFTISYEGESANHWPSESANMFNEAIVRDVLFTNGICNLDKLDPVLHQVKFRVLALIETEYLVALPYPTESDNIGGLLMVCVNHYLAKDSR